MELPNHKQLKSDAAYALRRGREPKKVIAWYAGASALLAALLTVAHYWLGQQIGNTGGLGNLGTRTMLSTVQTLLPLIQTLILSCLELGYLHAMLRICRGQYADHTDLKVGFRKAFPLLRLLGLQCLLYFGAILLSSQLASTVYLFTPWADGFLQLVEATGITTTDMITDAFIAQATPALIPFLVIWAVLLCVLLLPLSYRLRLSMLALLDAPRGSAFQAMRESFKMTRRNCVKLFRLDISFWWYYLLMFLATAVSYLDTVVPMDPILAYFLFYGLYLAASFAISWFFLNRVQSTYVMAYEALRDKPANDGVVLGSIFDL